MNIAQTKDRFRSFLVAHGKPVNTLLPEDLLQLGFDFFEQARVEDARPVTTEEMGDALLFQWGTRRALPGYYGACFYFGLTRQFISHVDQDDDAMYQLTCTLQYELTDELEAIGTGSQWCESLDLLTEFRRFAFQHPALAAVRGKTPSEREFYLSGV